MERDHDWRREQNMISKIRANIIKLIKREANWVPSLLFSHTLQCFVCADELRRKEGYRD